MMVKLAYKLDKRKRLIFAGGDSWLAQVLSHWVQIPNLIFLVLISFQKIFLFMLVSQI